MSKYYITEIYFYPRMAKDNSHIQYYWYNNVFKYAFPMHQSNAFYQDVLLCYKN